LSQALPHRVHFVHGSFRRWTDVASEDGRRLTLADLGPRLQLGREIWGVQAFHVLRGRGHDVTLSGTLDETAINVVHADDFPWRDTPWRSFVVIVRADREPTFAGQIEIVQNATCRWMDTDIYVPHWPQPGLLPRDPARGDRVETLTYLGKEANLASGFRSDAFRAALARLGVRLVIHEREWWDYRETDVVLAVRDGSPMYLSIKPASKLVNAWMAGCPAVLSDEAGYRELRRGPLDYFAAATPADVLLALTALRDDSQLFRKMVDNGMRRADAHSVERVADRWEEVLAGPVAERFEAWARASALSRSLRPPRHVLAYARHRVWGYQSVQPPPRPGRRFLNAVRRAVTLPSALAFGTPRKDG
jgi:hypothetical protein